MRQWIWVVAALGCAQAASAQNLIEGSRRSWKSALGLTCAGLGISALGLGIAGVFDAERVRGAMNGFPNLDENSVFTAKAMELRWQRAQLTAGISFGVAAALGGVAIWLLVADRPRRVVAAPALAIIPGGFLAGVTWQL